MKNKFITEKFIYGGDYNPEQWSPDIWQEDVKLMQIAGVNLVSLGIFSWALLEPEAGEFNFDWLDTIMDLLDQHKIKVNLATPTASPPAWMVTQHPDILPIQADGSVFWHGSRRHYCPHNPHYHDYAKRIATKLAERYKDHPSLVMWHIDNEYACHNAECFCENSIQTFRNWLQIKYGTIKNLNEAWGTTFWGQLYSDWNQIIPPKKVPAWVNPTQQLDWARFISDSWIECFKEQKEIIEKITPDIPITTNFMGFHKAIDYWKLSEIEDLVANDFYPDTYKDDWQVESAMVANLIRSLSNTKTWLLMEQSTSHVNWRTRNVNKRPGIMSLASYQNIAHGADGIMFFQWRASKAGTEKFHSGMVPHAGTKTRVWEEVKKLGNELPYLQEILNSKVEAEIGILFDWENWWAIEADSKPLNDFELIPQIKKIANVLYENNYSFDFVLPSGDFSSYKMLIAPHLYLISDESLNNIKNYVENGGNIWMTYFSGIVDENDHVRLGGYPGELNDLFGIRIEEFAAQHINWKSNIQTINGKLFECSNWADVIRLEGAKCLATFDDDYFIGQPALTCHDFSKGKAFYSGTEMDNLGLNWWVNHICSKSDCKPVLANLPKGVEAVRRCGDFNSYLFLLNMTNYKKEIDYISGEDLITAKKYNKVILNPFEVLVIDEGVIE